MKFVDYASDLPATVLHSRAVEIFNAFIHCHLAQPYGNRSVVNVFVVNCYGSDRFYLI